MKAICRITPWMLIYYLAAVVLLFSCSKSGKGPENNNTITVSGKVVLEGENDHSGVTIGFYAVAAMDTAITHLQQTYPNLGVQLNHAFAFDHRQQAPVYTATTNALGEWQIQNVNAGTYHIVAESADHGWRYLLNRSIQGSVTISGLDTLYQVIRRAGNISGDVVLKPYQHLEITGNAVINPGVTVSVPRGAYLRLAANVILTNSGTLRVVGTASEPAHIVAGNAAEQWRNIVNSSSGRYELQYAAISGSNLGITIEGDIPARVDHCYFTNNGTALQITSRSTMTLENLVFTNNSMGLAFGNVNPMQVRWSIFRENGSGINGSSANATVENCYFGLNGTALDVGVGNYTVQHCLIKQNTLGIVTTARQDYQVLDNQFEGNRTDVQCGYVYNTGAGLLVMHGNNFVNTTDFYLNQTQGALRDTVQASNNWWGTTDVTGIYARIQDCEDFNMLQCVNIEPVLQELNSNAGLEK